jgi:hypothetical protein
MTETRYWTQLATERGVEANFAALRRDLEAASEDR